MGEPSHRHVVSYGNSPDHPPRYSLTGCNQTALDISPLYASFLGVEHNGNYMQNRSLRGLLTPLRFAFLLHIIDIMLNLCKGQMRGSATLPLSAALMHKPTTSRFLSEAPPDHPPLYSLTTCEPNRLVGRCKQRGRLLA